jgi:sRNA-binding protein
MEENNVLDLMEAAQRLETVAASLEEAAARIAQVQAERQARRQQPVEEPVGRIVATIEEEAAPSSSLREVELEQRLASLEAQIAQMTAHPAAPAGGRKTVSPGTSAMLAKQGVSVAAGSGALEAAALDGALASLSSGLSIEQRIAVKAELLRAGLLG